MKILAMETSGRSLGVALWEDGKILFEVFENSGFVHSQKLVPVVFKLLQKARWDIKSLDKIAVSTGPGSFTGIRVGFTCAKVLAQSVDIPLVGVDALSLLKSAVTESDCAVVPAIDAGRAEVYVKNKAIEIVPAEKYFRSLRKLKKKVMVVGNASVVYKNIIAAELIGMAVVTPDKYIFPKAGILAAMAAKIPGRNFKYIKPLYVRRSWAEENRSNR